MLYIYIISHIYMLSVCPLFIRHCMLRSFAPAAGPPSGSCWLAAGSLACLLAGWDVQGVRAALQVAEVAAGGIGGSSTMRVLKGSGHGPTHKHVYLYIYIYIYIC